METAEHREPYEPRGSRTDLGAPGGESPPGDSTWLAIEADRTERPRVDSRGSSVVTRTTGIGREAVEEPRSIQRGSFLAMFPLTNPSQYEVRKMMIAVEAVHASPCLVSTTQPQPRW
jgi:hypothetical protein